MPASNSKKKGSPALALAHYKSYTHQNLRAECKAALQQPVAGNPSSSILRVVFGEGNVAQTRASPGMCMIAP